MDFSFSTEQQLLRQNIIEFAQKELNKNVMERDQQQSFPQELWLKCGEQKLQGLAADKNYGGAGLDPLSAIIAVEALGYGSQDGGLNFAICAHLFAGVIPIGKFGTEEQKKKYLPELCNGKNIIVNAMTETASGSDAFNIKTTAKKKENGYVINGTKTFSSNGPVANTILLYAMTDESKGFHGGITAFIIDSKTEGFKAGQKFDKMGLRSCNMSELQFENVFVPETSILGGVGGGATVFSYSMDWERTGMAACQAGTMERLLEQSISYAQNRVVGNEAIGKKQAVAHRIANMKVQLEASKMLVYKAAKGLENNKSNSMDASIAKYFVSEAFTSAAMDTLQIHGASGYMTSNGIERMVRDAIGSTLYSGTSDIQLNIISRWLGL